MSEELKAKQREFWARVTDCFFSAPKTTVDCVHPDTGAGIWGGRTLEQVREEYPNAVQMSIDEAARLRAGHFRQPPQRTTADEFSDMLNILPPYGWQTGPGWEVFKMSELTSGNITRIFCRIGTDFFTLSDDIDMPADDVVARCNTLRNGEGA